VQQALWSNSQGKFERQRAIVCACAGCAAVELTTVRSNAARMDVCWVGCCGRTHQGEVKRSVQNAVERTPVRSNVETQNNPKKNYTRITIKIYTKTTKRKTCYKTIFLQKRTKYLHKQNKIFTQTPPNLKRHIVHNVTELI
jgi:hypothetical protein